MNYDELYKTLNQKVSLFVKPSAPQLTFGNPNAPANVPFVKISPLVYIAIANVVIALVLIIASPEFLMTKNPDADDPVMVRSWGKMFGMIALLVAVSFGLVYKFYLRTR